MTITARATCTKNATYTKTVPGKPPQSFARQIVRYYDVSGMSMLGISTTVKAIKAYLDGSLNVSTVYPEIYRDETVSDWKEESWTINW